MKLRALSPAAFAFWLASAATAHATCLPNVLPQFSSLAFANGFSQQDCENLQGTQSTALGSSLVGNADATAIADFSLKAKAEAIYTDPLPGDGVTEGLAQASWQDQFRVATPGIGQQRFLAFTLSLTGSITEVGSGNR